MCKTNQRYLGQATALLALVMSIGCNTVRPMSAPGSGIALSERLDITGSRGATAAQERTPPPVPPNSTEPPAVTGTRLQTTDSETATERAIELTRKLNEAETDRKRLAARIQELEASAKVKDQALDQARTEIQSARAEMTRARQELEQWKLEITSLRDKLRGADEENLQTLQTAVSLLKQILAQAEDHEATSASSARSASD